MDYKKILEGVVDIINATEKSDIGFANICAYIGENCPELKESEDERIRKEILKFIRMEVEDEIVGNKWIAWLEKQGEQKETLCDKCKKEQPSHSCQDITALGRCALEKQSEKKPIDKVEPKFKVEDWIIHQGTENIYQVVARIDNQYQLKYGDNYTVQKCADVDRCARLWDITKDAKDGDVLVCEDFGYTSLMLFESFSNGSISFHCWYNIQTNNFHINTNVALRKDENINPATKEQREQLERAMADAGYTFDFEKKELKKIEQNPTWSDEDDSKINAIIQFIEDNYLSYSKNKEPIEWLDWLKSIKDRYTWKPSDELLNNILDVLSFDNCTPKRRELLESLYKQLKKLREK